MPTHCKVSHCVDTVLHYLHPLLIFVHSLFGDEQEVAFWTVALYYMLREKNRLQDPRYKVTLLLFKLASLFECCTVLIGVQVCSSS